MPYYGNSVTLCRRDRNMPFASWRLYKLLGNNLFISPPFIFMPHTDMARKDAYTCVP